MLLRQSLFPSNAAIRWTILGAVSAPITRSAPLHCCSPFQASSANCAVNVQTGQPRRGDSDNVDMYPAKGTITLSLTMSQPGELGNASKWSQIAATMMR